MGTNQVSKNTPDSSAPSFARQLTMNNPDPETNLPWYKQFWPWFLMALPGSVVVASIITIFIAADKPDTVVLDDYYKQGLAINQDLSRDQLAIQLGISATLKITEKKIIVSLKTPDKIQPAYILLRLMHPTLAEKDQQLKLSRIAPMVYSTKISAVSSGNWNIRLEANNPDWRIQKRIKISAQKSQYLLP